LAAILSVSGRLTGNMPTRHQHPIDKLTLLYIFISLLLSRYNKLTCS